MTAPLYLDVWANVFAGATYPGPLWMDDHHPSTAGYAAINAALVAALPDPGGRPVYALGDSWLTLGGAALSAALGAAWGHSVVYVQADWFGHDLDYQLGRWWSSLAGDEPAAVINYMGYVHELAEPVAFAQFNTRRLMALTAFMGARLVSLGVAPAPAPDDTAAAALYPAIAATLGA